LTQAAVANEAHVSRSTLDALENSRLGELGYSKIANILAVIGLELTLNEATGRRPTLDELMVENQKEE
jgi:transcriptional regulator with XRE-family HTH domain